MEGIAQHHLILEEARKNGLSIILIENNDCKLHHQISNSKGTIELINGINRNVIFRDFESLCDDKCKTKELLVNLDINTPRWSSFRHIDDLKDFHFNNKDWVVKPSIGINGIGVNTNVKDQNDLQQYWDNYQSLGSSFLIEEKIDGTDFRIQVINSEIVAACERVPAHVVGDGKRTLEELINERQQIIKQQNAANRLVIDLISTTLLNHQNV